MKSALLALLTTLLLACGPTPEGSDYHSREADLAGLDLRPTELPPIDLLPGDGGRANPDADSTSGPTDQQAPDLPTDQPTPVPTVRTCLRTLAFSPPDQSPVFLAADFTDWAAGQVPLQDPDGDGTWTLDLDLATLDPGSYSYKFHTAADNWYLDPSNPLARWTDGIENSRLPVPDCTVPELILDSWNLSEGGTRLEATVTVANPATSAGIIPAAARLLVNGEEQPASGYDAAEGRFDLLLDDLPPGQRITLRLAIANENGPAPEFFFPVWTDDEPWNWQDASIYFAFTDRFANGSAANDAPAACTGSDSLTNWQGGDFQGIRQQVEAGYFTELGINVLWLSPVIDNPDGCMSGTLEGVTYTAYHGYFPLDLYATENHFGTLQDLRALVDAAHARGIRVLIDFVGNHLHEDNPLYQQHQGDGWFHGFNLCEPNWDKPIECWFMPYLPDLDYTHDDVVDLATQNALYWILESGVDGFRVDAVKHMVHNFIRSLRYEIEHRTVTAAAPFYMVGETFMGEWGGGTGMAETVIKEYVGPWELNGQFDFPFYWKITKAVARDEGDFLELAAFLEEALPFWGSEAVMVSFIGNHDVPRFLSHAAGQIGDLWGNGSKLQGLTAPPPLPVDEEPFLRLRLAQGLLFTLPEVPLIYYGDELGLPGAGDPDNRRVMPFDNLSPRQEDTLAWTRAAGTLRSQQPALRRGTFKILSVSADTIVFQRALGSDKLLVAANRAAAQRTVTLPGIAAGTVTELLSGTDLALAAGGTLTLPPFGMAVVDGGAP